MNPVLSVVMPTHNRSKLLARVLDAYDRQSGTFPFELVAADDASSDATPELLREYRPRRFTLKAIVLARNGGPGRARNEALAQARAPLVLIVGDDIMPSEDFLAQHLAAHGRHPEAQAAILGRTTWPLDLPVNSLMRHIDGIGAQQFSYAHMRDDQELDFRHFYTSNVSLKRSLLDRVQPWFDPAFIHPAYEDAELGYRLSRQAGLRIHYAAAAHATHYHHYGVETFAVRQYRCGLMASVFLRKHPELRPVWRTNRLLHLARLASVPPLRGFLNRLPDAELEAAERRAIVLGTECESREGSVVDRIYLVLLEYFVLTGMLEGEFGVARARRPRAALLLFGLLYHLGVLAEDGGAEGLATTSAGLAFLETSRHYDRARRRWPRGLRWLLLAPVRSMVVPRY
jgi:glycosyltransferase involved in cell wall biosynthesis